MSENEWIDLSDNMEKNDGYVKRDPQAMKERPGNNKTSAFTCLSLYMHTHLPTSHLIPSFLLLTYHHIRSNIIEYHLTSLYYNT